METNYETAKKLFDIARGLDEVFQARAITGNDDYKTETMSIMSARDRISDLATLLAKDEATSQEIDKQEQETVDSHFEERQMDDEEKEKRMNEIEDDEFRHGEERVKEQEQDLSH